MKKTIIIFITLVSFLLIQNINAQDIFKAVRDNDIEKIKEMLKKDPNLAVLKDQYERTALHPAAYAGKLDICKILIENGADVNINSLVGTALHRACFRNNKEVVKLLLDNNADINLQNSTGTVIHTVALVDAPDIAELLIKRGGDVNTLNNGGLSPLYYAISNGSNRSDEMAVLLIKNGANVNLKSAQGESLLQVAADNGFTKVARLMIEKGADKSVLSMESFQSLLHLAAINGYSDMAKMLIDLGLDVNLKDKFGNSPLYYTGLHGNKTVDLVLKKAGAKNEKITKNYQPSSLLNKKIKKDEAFIWHMDNRGWSIKTREHLLVFDNEERGRRPDIPSLFNGFVSASEIADQNVISFYSTYHAAPNTMEFIHAIEDSIKNINYLNYKDDRWRGGKNTFYLKGRELQKIDNIEIRTIETHETHGMGSLGYLIKTDGLTIYYGCFPTELLEEYKKEIDYISAYVDKCDLAFIQFATGKEEECINYVIEKLKPSVVLPITMSSNKLKHKEMAYKIDKKFSDIQTVSPVNSGEMFVYKNGKIK